MKIGPYIRQMLGPLERPISEFYRSVFIDLTAFVDQIRHWVSASTILDLGCGEGAVSEGLIKAFPDASLTGIDITPRVGRMFSGDPSRVTFKQQTIQEFAPQHQAVFDLVVISDILHHIPWELHREILTNARQITKPGGYLVIKDWERNATLIHYLCHFLDRYITGDRVRYKSADELRELIVEVFGQDSIKAEARIPPRINNIAFLVQI